MATIYWTGAARDGNWNTVTNWSGGALPVNNDAVYVSRNAQSGMSLNLDRTGDTAGAGLDLDLFEIEEGFRFDIGTPSVYLQMAADEVMDRGNGNVYYKSNDGSATIDTDLVTVRKPTANGIFELVNDNVTSNVAQLRIVSGRCKFHGGLTLPLAYLAPLPESELFTSLETDGVSGITNMYQAGGTCRFRSASAAYYISSGSLILGDEYQTLNITTINQSGGYVNFIEGTQDFACTTYTGLGGTLDVSITTGQVNTIGLRKGPQFTLIEGPKIVISPFVILGD